MNYKSTSFSKLILLFCFQLLLGSTLFGQNDRLAQHFFDRAEYAKAASIYKQLYAKNPNNVNYFKRYIRSLAYEPNLDAAKAALQSQLKKGQSIALSYLLLSEIAEIEGLEEEMQTHLNNVKEHIPADPNQVLQIANELVKKSQYDEAIRVIEYAESKHHLKGAFERELANYYRYAGDLENMMVKQLELIGKYPQSIKEVKDVWSDYLSNDDYKKALKMTFAQIQKQPQVQEYTDLLAWTYIQLGDYETALRQLIALDKRSNGDGFKVYNLGTQAFNIKKYDVAVKAYNYILDNKEKSSPFYIPSKYSLLNSYKALHHSEYEVNLEEMQKISEEYRAFFKEFPVTNKNILMLRDWAEVLAFDLAQLNEATELIEQNMNSKGLNDHAVGNLKLLLGDIYLLNENRWEATLLYSQVDKKFREGLLGEQARFKNAKLSYFLGDFDWAQTQFEVLKTATSRLIANDAIDLSVFITDNLGLDTSSHAVSDYALAEFLRFKRRYRESEQLLKNMLQDYPEHSLTDDIYYELANLYRDEQQFDIALDYYSKILEEYSDEIRADNALIEMAKIYDYAKKNSQKAMELYEKLFIDYSSSTYSVEARKRFRQLRGDEIE